MPAPRFKIDERRRVRRRLKTQGGSDVEANEVLRIVEIIPIGQKNPSYLYILVRAEVEEPSSHDKVALKHREVMNQTCQLS